MGVPDYTSINQNRSYIHEIEGLFHGVWGLPKITAYKVIVFPHVFNPLKIVEKLDVQIFMRFIANNWIIDFVRYIYFTNPVGERYVATFPDV